MSRTVVRNVSAVPEPGAQLHPRASVSPCANAVALGRGPALASHQKALRDEIKSRVGVSAGGSLNGVFGQTQRVGIASRDAVHPHFDMGCEVAGLDDLSEQPGE
jgi:hypothetical protein